MASKSKNKQAQKPVESAPVANILPHADLLEKPLTKTQQAFVDHIVATTGYDVDPTSVKLASRLGGEFRNSPERKAERDARKAELVEQRATVEQRRQAKRDERAAKLEAQAKDIREGKTRGPGRPRKDAVETVEEVGSTEDDEFDDDDETADTDAVDTESEDEDDESDEDDEDDF